MNKIPCVVDEYDTIHLNARHKVFDQGQICNNYIVVTSGMVKVYTRSNEGKELVLYRIQPGEICVLTTSCLMGYSHYPAEAVTETEVSARVIPRRDFELLIGESPAFREFVFQNFSLRLVDLMSQLEFIALESVGYRLNKYLYKNANRDNRIIATHQEISTEIGSAREVVSRHLKALEKQQAIVLHRGSIELINPQVLLN
ncbi:Crp/Fnr family transcriptional regulator [Thalassomonas actiniarum]|uniref:Crp/Fnr family transcriptional regulator n=1 Tax=Thalassomonas actiniarum TaxID=485447 RepID=A0AAE9YUV4_9GAMM|nr:Crp/Fnr family transcriptional regulator [Thalassomonas actiniarum]WDE00997.1 Crp/Fnr family transcriptional regulator [Thalassomonas actiniarum]